MNSIPLQEARLRALSLLKDNNLFICVAADGNPYPPLESLPLGIIELFQRYERIEAVSAGSPRIERGLVGQTARQQRYQLNLVGHCMEGSDVEFDLGVLPGDERLYEVYSNEVPDPSTGVYDSVFHWILATAERS